MKRSILLVFAFTTLALASAQDKIKTCHDVNNQIAELLRKANDPSVEIRVLQDNPMIKSLKLGGEIRPGTPKTHSPTKAYATSQLIL
jgi:hypothetical protein